MVHSCECWFADIFMEMKRPFICIVETLNMKWWDISISIQIHTSIKHLSCLSCHFSNISLILRYIFISHVCISFTIVVAATVVVSHFVYLLWFNGLFFIIIFVFYWITSIQRMDYNRVHFSTVSATYPRTAKKLEIVV